MNIKSAFIYPLAPCLLAVPLPVAAAQVPAATQAELPVMPVTATSVSAKEAAVPDTASQTVSASAESHASAAPASSAMKIQTSSAESAKSSSQVSHSQDNIEVQVEYLDARFFENRDVNLYNLHVYRQYKTLGALSLHYGLTLERAVGSTTEDDIYRDAEAVGFGPSYMMRWTRHVSGKLDASLDGTGSILAYNHAHPGNGRAYGFLWRIGPRLTYHYTDRDAVSLAYIFHHSSNGFKSHNPGYNGVGFSLGFTHNF